MPTAPPEPSDFGLVGAFETMKTKKTWVVAAAAGTVLEVVDVHFDKCGLNLGRIDDIDDIIRMLNSPTCDDDKVNKIVIDHGHGIVTQYLHLKRDSIQVVPGQAVTCGQKLAEVGSSGKSIMPHLHFDVIDNGAHVDPYGGPVSTRSYWRKQGSGRLPEAACPRPRKHRGPAGRRARPRPAP